MFANVFDWRNGTASKQCFRGAYKPGSYPGLYDLMYLFNFNSAQIVVAPGDSFNYQFSFDSGNTWTGGATGITATTNVILPDAATGIQVVRTAGTGASTLTVSDTYTGIVLADTIPPNESLTGAIGAGVKGARNDHSHPRLTSVTGLHTLDVNGEVQVDFTRTFPVGVNPPGVVCLLVEAVDQPPIFFKVKNFIQSGGIYTGVIIKGYRGQTLPLLSGIVLVGPLVTALSNFNPFGGNPAGATFTCIAVMSSQS